MAYGPLPCNLTSGTASYCDTFLSKVCPCVAKLHVVSGYSMRKIVLSIYCPAVFGAGSEEDA